MSILIKISRYQRDLSPSLIYYVVISASTIAMGSCCSKPKVVEPTISESKPTAAPSESLPTVTVSQHQTKRFRMKCPKFDSMDAAELCEGICNGCRCLCLCCIALAEIAEGCEDCDCDFDFD